MERRDFMALLGRSALLSAVVPPFGMVSMSSARAQQRGGTMVIAVSGEPNAIVGFTHTDTSGHMVAANVFSGLIGYNDKFEPIPQLADSWNISKDGLTYTFYLNKKAKFHDGVPVTAHDVAFTFNEVVSKHHPSRSAWWPNVEEAVAADAHTFVFKLKKPFPPLMSLLAYELRSGSEILPKHLYEGKDAKTNPVNEKPIGCGAFKFKEWVKGSHVELVRNDDYFMDDLPYLDRVIVQSIPDPSTRILAFERGEVDFIDFTAVPHSEVKRLVADERFKMVGDSDAISSVGMLLCNHRHKALGSKAVRQAIFFALDTDDIADKAFFGASRAARSVIGSGMAWAYDPSFDIYERDVEKANKMLDDAGFNRDANGVRFEVRIFWATGRNYDGKAAELVRDQLREIGVKALVQTFDRPTYIQTVFDRWDFDMAVQGFSTGPDPAISVVSRYHTKQINHAPFTNAMGYSNSELDKIFDADANETELAKRKEYWKQAQKILMDELPGIPMFELPAGHLSNAKLVDAVTGPFGYFQSRHKAYFKS